MRVKKYGELKINCKIGFFFQNFKKNIKIKLKPCLVKHKHMF